MLNTTRFENTRLEGFAVLEIQDPRLKGFIPLRHSAVSGTVAGPLAELTLTQTFSFPKTAFDGAIEALYRFPLPGDAAVLGVTVRFGETELEAVLQERVVAEAEYAEAKREGRQAALVTRESPDVFTLHVAGVLPDQEVLVTTRFVQLARAEENSQWSLRLPLTTAPRYVRADEQGSPHAHGNPLFTLRDPGHRFSLDLTLKGAASASCATHHPTLTVCDEGLNLRLESVLPDRDCVLTWRAAAPEASVGLSVFTHGNYYLAQVAPPLSASEAGLPREVIVLVDHSGSMEGAKWQAADWAVTRFLSSLNPQDRFALGLFHNNCRWLSRELRPGTVQAVREATAFLKKHTDSGGTELGVALEQALGLPRVPGERVARHVLIVTDAEVSDAGRLLNLVGQEAKQHARRRVSVICVDAAPNSQLVLQLAERGGGSAHFLTSDPDQDDITTALDSLLREWDAPLHTGLTLRAGEHKQDLGDLPMGQARWVLGELPAPAESGSAFTLESHGTLLANALPQPGPAALRALVGVRRVNALEYLLTGRHQPYEILEALRALGLPELPRSATLYPENAPLDYAPHLRKLLITESLAAGIASSVTAFSATRKERGQLVVVTVPIANARPKGSGSDRDTRSINGAGGAGFGSIQTLSKSVVTSAFDIDMERERGVMPKTQAPQSPAPSGGGFFSRFRRAAAPSAQEISLSDSDDDEASINAFAIETLELEGEPDGSGVYDLDEGGTQQFIAFSGVPSFNESGEAVLYDSQDNLKKAMNLGNLLTLLKLRYPTGAPGALDTGLVLLLFVDDLGTPRAQVRLSDLLRLGGERPLNLRRSGSARVRLVLRDDNRTWAQNPPRLEVLLG
jgi:Ca-activated chloride channel homolog